jgi:hypothetical protein
MTYIQHALKVLNRACPALAPEHDAWAVWRNTTRPDHPSLVPFDQLTPDVQELDRTYMDAIHRTARQVTR